MHSAVEVVGGHRHLADLGIGDPAAVVQFRVDLLQLTGQLQVGHHVRVEAAALEQALDDLAVLLDHLPVDRLGKDLVVGQRGATRFGELLGPTERRDFVHPHHRSDEAGVLTTETHLVLDHVVVRVHRLVGECVDELLVERIVPPVVERARCPVLHGAAQVVQAKPGARAVHAAHQLTDEATAGVVQALDGAHRRGGPFEHLVELVDRLRVDLDLVGLVDQDQRFAGRVGVGRKQLVGT